MPPLSLFRSDPVRTLLLLSPLMFQGEKNKYSVPLASFIPQSAVNRRIYQETREDEQ